MNINFEWDENKRRENIRKHGIDFVDLPPLFDGVIITIEDRRHDYGETRYITLGLLKHHVIVVVHTDREGNIRIISARKATKNESKRYFEEITN
jgi:uncharacterized protein